MESEHTDIQKNKKLWYTKKLAHMALYIIKLHRGSVNGEYLMHMMYLADKEALDQWGFSISTETQWKYHGSENSPSRLYLHKLITGIADPEEQKIWDSIIKKTVIKRTMKYTIQYWKEYWVMELREFVLTMDLLLGAEN